MSHFYSADGRLYDRIEYSDPKRKGQYRDFTLRDARPLGLYPSVTSILQTLNKPALTKWQVEQGIKAAIGHGSYELYTETDAIADAYYHSQEYTRWTQEFGTATHWWLNYKLKQRNGLDRVGIPPIIPHTEELAEATLAYLDANGFVFTHTERTVVDPVKGYAGTIDLLGTHYGEPCLVDLKTQSDPLTPYDPEHALQLVAYDGLLEPAEVPCPCEICDDRERIGSPRHGKQVHRQLISLIANRDNIGRFKLHQWQDIGRYREMWHHLVEFWMLQHKYDPREAI